MNNRARSLAGGKAQIHPRAAHGRAHSTPFSDATVLPNRRGADLKNPQGIAEERFTAGNAKECCGNNGRRR